MKKCLIIGGGFAGLSAGVYLADKEIDVTLIEASPKLGGRAYSIFNPRQNDYFDNGQHIMMGCYESTINFLSKIDAIGNVDFQKSLMINFVEQGGKVHKLLSPRFFYPLNLLIAILNYSAISLKSRLKIIEFMLKNFFYRNESLNNLTVEEWLKEENQSLESIKAFWEIIVVGALNTKIEKAAAQIFSEILKKIFGGGKFSSSILVPNSDLTNLYVNKSIEFINKRNGKIFASERVLKLIADGDMIVKAVTNKNTYENYDYIISSIPSYSLKKIKIENHKSILDFSFIPSLEYSPILNVHLWLKENPFNEKFYGLISSKIHWLFNHGKHISLTISAADELINMAEHELLFHLYSDLERYFPIFQRKFVIDYEIIKEKRATFVPDIFSTEERKKIKSPFDNLIIAGDWTNTKLPSTIESAVLSGSLAAEKVINTLKVTAISK